MQVLVVGYEHIKEAGFGKEPVDRGTWEGGVFGVEFDAVGEEGREIRYTQAPNLPQFDKAFYDRYTRIVIHQYYNL